MRINRKSAAMLATSAIVLGIGAAPAMAIVVPVPEDTPISSPSPAMSAGRAFCACSGMAYEPLWID